MNQLRSWIKTITCQKQKFGTYRGKNLKSFGLHFSILRKEEPLNRRSQGKIFVKPNWPSLETFRALERRKYSYANYGFDMVPKCPTCWKCPLYQVIAVLNILKAKMSPTWPKSCHGMAKPLEIPWSGKANQGQICCKHGLAWSQKEDTP